jgi:hypothetical protein
MAMNFGLAQRYLMQALAMKRKNVKRLKERIAEGKCIIDGCDRSYVSRGLCDSHRQAFYNALKLQDGKEAKLEFEQEQIREGLILADGEQGSWTSKNPFQKSVGA